MRCRCISPGAGYLPLILRESSVARLHGLDGVDQKRVTHELRVLPTWRALYDRPRPTRRRTDCGMMLA